jgi:hypothetical protein
MLFAVIDSIHGILRSMSYRLDQFVVAVGTPRARRKALARGADTPHAPHRMGNAWARGVL